MSQGRAVHSMEMLQLLTPALPALPWRSRVPPLFLCSTPTLPNNYPNVLVVRTLPSHAYLPITLSEHMISSAPARDTSNPQEGSHQHPTAKTGGSCWLHLLSLPLQRSPSSYLHLAVGPASPLPRAAPSVTTSSSGMFNNFFQHVNAPSVFHL